MTEWFLCPVPKSDLLDLDPHHDSELLYSHNNYDRAETPVERKSGYLASAFSNTITVASSISGARKECEIICSPPTRLIGGTKS